MLLVVFLMLATWWWWSFTTSRLVSLPFCLLSLVIWWICDLFTITIVWSSSTSLGIIIPGWSSGSFKNSLCTFFHLKFAWTYFSPLICGDFHDGDDDAEQTYDQLWALLLPRYHCTFLIYFRNFQLFWNAWFVGAFVSFSFNEELI